MCANFQTPSKKKLEQLLPIQPSFNFEEDIYPSYEAPIIFKSAHGWEWRKAQFRLVPKWTDDPKFSRFTYNARTETIATKPSFKDPWLKSQFCLIPAEAFYEPLYQSTKPQIQGIQRKDGDLFTIAGLYEITKINDQIIRSFTMLTVNADEHPLMKHFHQPNDEKRSIVIIPPHQRDAWLSAQHQDASQFLKLFDAEEFYAKPKPIKPSAQASLF